MTIEWEYQIFWAWIDKNGIWKFHSAYDFVKKERFFEWLESGGWEIERITLSIFTPHIEDYEGIQKLWISGDYDPFQVIKKSSQVKVELYCKRPMKDKYPK